MTSTTTSYTNEAYSDDQGNAVYVVDADTGDLIWKAAKTGECGALPSGAICYENPNLEDSIPSDIQLVDIDDTGPPYITELGYVGDTGGRVWRIDFRDSDPNNWTMEYILSAGRHEQEDGGTVSDADLADRRFFHDPDVIYASDSTSAYEAVMIGSGNRPHPREELHTDQVYLVKDRITSAGFGTSYVGAVTRTSEELADLTDFTCDDAADPPCTADNIDATDPDTSEKLTDRGWLIDLERDGEKLLSSPLTFGGQSWFTSYVPAGGSGGGICEPHEGESHTYVINLADATPVFRFGDDGGYARSTYTGDGISGDVIKFGIDGWTFITPGNIPPGLGRTPIQAGEYSKTLWQEIRQ